MCAVLGRSIFRMRDAESCQMFIGSIMCSLDSPDSFLYGLFLKHDDGNHNSREGTLNAIINDPRALLWTENRFYNPPNGRCSGFQLDLAAMREQARPFAEEIAARVFHPRRVIAWEAQGLDVLQDM